MLTAGEIRRRGDRRRSRRRVATGAGVLVVGLIAGIAVWQGPLTGGRADPDWANPPSILPTPSLSSSPSSPESPSPSTPESTSDSPPPSSTASPAATTPPTWANLPEVDEVLEPGYGVVKDEHEGTGSTAIGLCAPSSLAGPTTTLVREYGSKDYPVDTWAVVLGYPNAEAASVGFNRINDAAVECATRLEDDGLTDARIHDASDEVAFDPSSVDADPVRVGYSSGFGLIPDDPDQNGRWTQTTVIQAGERVLWVTNQFDGMDLNCTVSADPDMEQCGLVAAIPRLLTRLVR